MNCDFCGQKGFEGVVCPKCKKDMVFEAHNKYNEYRCTNDAPATTIGDLNFIHGDNESSRGGWQEYVKRLTQGV